MSRCPTPTSSQAGPVLPSARTGSPHEVFTRDPDAGSGPGVVLEKAFGPGWRAIPLDSEPGNSHHIHKREHSVLTSAVVEQPGHPTHEARAEVTTFLKEWLVPA
jgi:hypothetical protein